MPSISPYPKLLVLIQVKVLQQHLSTQDFSLSLRAVLFFSGNVTNEVYATANGSGIKIISAIGKQLQ